MRLSLPARLPLRLALALAALHLVGCGGTSSSTCSGAPQTVQATAAWQAFGPAEWSACTLNVRAPALGADERLAVLLVNASGDDNGAATLSVTGTGAAAEAPGAAPLLRAEAAGPEVSRDDGLAPAIQQASLARWLAGAGRAALRRADRAVQAAAAIPATRSFCVYALPSFTTWVRKAATLRHESAHAAYYVTDDVWSHFQSVLAQRADLWATLDSYYEGTVSSRNLDGAKSIRGAISSSFGDQTDFDGNGKVIILFTDLSTKDSSGQATSFVAGYFDPNDVQAIDETPGCTAAGDGRGSNAADMLYLMDPYTYSSMGYPISTVIDDDLPSVMAHELQHNVLFNTRCCTGHPLCDPKDQGPRCAASSSPRATGDLWLNEGLSMVAQDVAGFGLNTPSGRQRVGAYLSCATSGSHTCHESASLTAWPSPGDPYGNYGAVHALLRWHLDQQAKVGPAAGPAFLKALVGATQDAKSAMAAASGLSFVEGSARFASAALFSGWSADPTAGAWDFDAGAAWSPLHSQLSWPSFDPIGASAVTETLRTDSWRAYQSGLGSGGDATLTVTVADTVVARPTVVVARVKKPLGTP